MILADTSIWIDHLRQGDGALRIRLSAGSIACHPLVIAEIALGSLKDRSTILSLLDRLPKLPVATPDEVTSMIETRRLYSRGIGYVDASLIAACFLTPGTRLWTRDKRLRNLAATIGIAAAGSEFERENSSRDHPQGGR